jgi:hypothetical protein
MSPALQAYPVSSSGWGTGQSSTDLVDRLFGLQITVVICKQEGSAEVIAIPVARDTRNPIRRDDADRLNVESIISLHVCKFFAPIAIATNVFSRRVNRRWVLLLTATTLFVAAGFYLWGLTGSSQSGISY